MATLVELRDEIEAGKTIDKVEEKTQSIFSSGEYESVKKEYGKYSLRHNFEQPERFATFEELLARTEEDNVYRDGDDDSDDNLLDCWEPVKQKDVPSADVLLAEGLMFCIETGQMNLAKLLMEMNFSMRTGAPVTMRSIKLYTEVKKAKEQGAQPVVRPAWYAQYESLKVSGETDQAELFYDDEILKGLNRLSEEMSYDQIQDNIQNVPLEWREQILKPLV